MTVVCWFVGLRNVALDSARRLLIVETMLLVGGTQASDVLRNAMVKHALDAC